MQKLQNIKQISLKLQKINTWVFQETKNDIHLFHRWYWGSCTYPKPSGCSPTFPALKALQEIGHEFQA